MSTNTTSNQIQIEEFEKSLQAMGEIYKQVLGQLMALKGTVEVDGLTTLLRRDSFMSRLGRELIEARCAGTELHLMMVDLDHFKKVNDTFGHQAGDEVLERVSQLVKNYLRPTDLAGRYGGEELIVAVECDEATARIIAERIRKAVEQVEFCTLDGAPFSVTLSLGMASSRQCGYDARSLIAKADAALYSAKRQGRNRVLVDAA